MSRGVLVDLARCMGCRSCQVACKAWNDNTHEVTVCLGCYDNPPRFSADTWSLIRFDEVAEGDELHWVFSKLQCMHCEHPGCAAACPVGALEKTPEGPVIYHDNKCIGCRYCQVACPFHAPTFQWDRPVPFIRKCTFCSDRVSQGIEPACVKACPTDALQFGEREALLAEARKRMAARPGKYVDHIYGEKEAGGTSWLYLSPVPFEMLGFIAYGAVKMGFPTIGPERVDKFASVAMGVVPAWILAASATLSGLYWFTRRREKGLQARKEGQAAHQEEA
jgi:formate dehydrogenase iron-sulfur subunit